MERLEQRFLLAADVLSYHNDLASTGVNASETSLTRSNVNSSTFGKVASLQVAGQVYAQPLIKRNVNITTGSFAGVHDVVFVATEHDQLYAFDAGTLNGADSPSTLGQLLWQHNFLDITNPNNHLLNATALTSVPQNDVISTDISVEIGITSTPVIDPATNTIYVLAKTKETVGGTAHWVQRIHAINIQDGTDRAVALVGDTTGANTNNTSIYAYGNGNGAVVDPYNGTGRQVVQFNALRESNQAALTLVNGIVYAGFGSHGDNGPFHGWMIGWDKNTLALKGVLNTTPNGGLGGIWMSGGIPSFDGTYFYVETGDGTFDGNNGSGTAANPIAPAPGPITGLNALGFPVNADYGGSFLKIALDPTTTPAAQNSNGWGLKVLDYFTPFNAAYLNSHALEVGSGAPLVLPDSVGSAARPHLLVGAGEEGVIYLIDRDNMGKYGLSNNIVQNLPNQLTGLLSTPAIYNGRLYFVEGFGGVAKTFTISAAHISNTPVSTSTDSFIFAGSTPSISANALADGIAWDVDRGTSQLRAYSSDTYATELYTSAQAGARDALGAAVKFQVPTVANGHVYLGSGTGEPKNFLLVYGLMPPPTAAPNAPSNMFGQPASNTQLNLSWTDNATAPNLADGFYIDQSSDGITNWQPIGITIQNNFQVSGLAAGTTYYFRIRAHDALGFSSYAFTAAATPGMGTGQSIDFSSGFPSATNLTLNGGATVSANRLHLTTAVASEARSVFFNTQQNIASFTTSFSYIKNGSADGATFVIQRDPRGLTALGTAGGTLGYGGANAITPSFALAINVYSGNPLGTEFLTNGTVDLRYTQTNINTAINNTPLAVTLTYSPGLLTAQFTQGAASETKTMAIDLPTLLGGSVAYVGFTGGTGGSTAAQDITSWTFDSDSPPPIPSRPDLTNFTDSGISSTDNITNDNTPTFTGIATPASTITVLQNGVPVGAGITPPSGLYSVTTSPLGDGLRNITATASISSGLSNPSTTLPVTIDTVAPAQSSPGVFQFLHYPQSVSFNLNEPVTAPANALALTNLTTSSQIPLAKIAQVSSPPSNLIWIFPGYPHGVLPDGNYHASLPIGAVSDIAGNQSTAELKFDFFVFTGDLNRDRQISISDFIDLASNFNNTSAIYTDGDLNYDGVVSISDFIDLSSKFNQSLPPPTVAAAPMSASATQIRSRPRRKISARRVSHHPHPNLLRFPLNI